MGIAGFWAPALGDVEPPPPDDFATWATGRRMHLDVKDSAVARSRRKRVSR